jgi:YHS domain-containing protein
MLRSILLLILLILVLRVVSRALMGMAAGPGGGRRRSQPGRGSADASAAGSVHMIRDPVCGTYVIPDRAFPSSDGGRRVFFCSAECRNKYQSRPAEGRTA